MANSNESTWTAQDKLAMYRSLNNLYNRERTNQINDSQILKKDNQNKIEELKNEIKRLRNLLTNSKSESSHTVSSILQENRELYLALKKLNPNQIKENLEERIFTKRKCYDKLQYKIESTKQKLLKTQLKFSQIPDGININECDEEEINSNKILNMKGHTQTNKNIQPFYEKMLSYLQKDKTFYMAALENAEKGAKLQQECILRAIEMGQLATEEVCNMKEEYKRRENDVRFHTQSQFETLKELDSQVAITVQQSRNLSRSRSLSNMGLTFAIESNIEGFENTQDKQVEELSELLVKIKKTILVPEFNDIFPWMLEQLTQQDKLMHDLNENDTQLGVLMTKIDHGRLILNSFINQGEVDVTNFEEQEYEVAKIIEQKSYELDFMGKEQNNVDEVMIVLRNAIVSLWSVVSPMMAERQKNMASQDTGLFEEAMQIINVIKIQSSIIKNPFENDGLTKKHESLRLTKNTGLQQLESLGNKSPSKVSLVFEDDFDDPTVPNRDTIKAESQKVVEAATADRYDSKHA